MFEYEDNYFEDMQELLGQYEAMKRGTEHVVFEQIDYEDLIGYFTDLSKNEEALEVCNLAIEQFPFSSCFLVSKAEILFDDQKIEDALALLEHAELMDVNDLGIYFLRSEIYITKSQHQQALATLDLALSIAAPNDMEALEDIYMRKADVFEDSEKYEEVIHYLRMALKLNPDNEEALSRMWFAIQILENYEDSKNYHEDFVEKHPYSFLAWHNLAHAYAGLNMPEKAVDAFEFVFAINDQYDYSYRDCGSILYKMGKYEKAAEYLIKASQIAKPYKELYFTIGLCYEHLNNHGRARYFYRKAINLDPQYSEAFFKIGENYRYEQLWDNALISIQRALKANEDNHEYLVSLAQTYYQLDELDHAIEAYKKAVRIKPDNMANWVELSKYLFENGEFDESLSVLDKGEDYCGKLAEFDYIRSAYHFAFGRRQQGAEFLERALSTEFNGHIILYEIVPALEYDTEVTRIIEQYKHY